MATPPPPHPRAPSRAGVRHRPLHFPARHCAASPSSGSASRCVVPPPLTPLCISRPCTACGALLCTALSCVSRRYLGAVLTGLFESIIKKDLNIAVWVVQQRLTATTAPCFLLCMDGSTDAQRAVQVLLSVITAETRVLIFAASKQAVPPAGNPVLGSSALGATGKDVQKYHSGRPSGKSKQKDSQTPGDMIANCECAHSALVSAGVDESCIRTIVVGEVDPPLEAVRTAELNLVQTIVTGSQGTDRSSAHLGAFTTQILRTVQHQNVLVVR